jgi:octaprenyl-diphosphate synthase
MGKLDDIRRPVSEEMKVFQKRFKSSVHSDVALLNIITSYTLRQKGKQVRPLFVFLTSKMLGGVTESTYTAASLIELLHTATLIHDDVVDESYERRGLFSINALWKSKTSVLLGDYFLSRGLLLAVEKNDHELLNIVSHSMKEMVEGELLQLQKTRSLNITIDDYYEVIRKKTATLIASCTSGAAKSVNASKEVIDQMYNLGINIGISFQIKDDIFDYQDRGAIGKPTGNDLREKKFTLPLIYSLDNCEKKEKKSIIRLISNGSMGNDKIDHIVKFVKSKGGLDYAKKMMLEYKAKADDVLLQYPESEARQSLLDLVQFTVDRTK